MNGCRVLDLRFGNASLIVDLMDGRTICAPLAWCPSLLGAMPERRGKWECAGAGYGIYWPDIGNDFSTEALLHGAPSSTAALAATSSHVPLTSCGCWAKKCHPRGSARQCSENYPKI